MTIVVSHRTILTKAILISLLVHRVQWNWGNTW